EEGVYRVRGRGVERLVVMTDMENEAAVRRMQRILERLGVVRELRELGAKDGDSVRIGEGEFDFLDCRRRMLRRIGGKVGTSTRTDASGGLDRGYVAELAAELAALAHAGRRVVLVSSGAIRAGCERLGWEGRPRTVPQKQAAAAVGQGRLMEIYAEAFG